MSTALACQIYRETLGFLETMGCIDEYRRVLEEENIDDRMTRVDVCSGGLETVDAIHCFLDEKRTLAFLDAIERQVRPNDVVVEAGVGTGILAIMAASLGAEVYGIEINESTLALADELSKHFIQKGILGREGLRLIRADASSWPSAKKIDVIISENIYTGMFYEMQLPILNHLLDYIGPSGRVIPGSMSSYVILTEVEKPPNKRHGECFSCCPEENRWFKWRELSTAVLYDGIDFGRRNLLDCSRTIDIPIMSSGAVNALLIYSSVTVDEQNILQRNDTTFMSEDIFIVLEPPLEVVEGLATRLQIEYRRGAKPEQGHYSIAVRRR